MTMYATQQVASRGNNSDFFSGGSKFEFRPNAYYPDRGLSFFLVYTGKF